MARRSGVGDVLVVVVALGAALYAYRRRDALVHWFTQWFEQMTTNGPPKGYGRDFLVPGTGTTAQDLLKLGWSFGQILTMIRDQMIGPAADTVVPGTGSTVGELIELGWSPEQILTMLGWGRAQANKNK